LQAAAFRLPLRDRQYPTLPAERWGADLDYQNGKVEVGVDLRA
jgi:hypothetical protein